MKSNLIENIRKVVPFSDAEIIKLEQYLVRTTFTKKAIVLTENAVCRNLYFIEKGCVRMFFINQKATEQIVQFALDGWWIADYKSFNTNTPSEYSIQAIENSEIITISKDKLDLLLDEIPNLEKYFRNLMQKEIAAAQLKTKLAFELSKEEFYFHFVTMFPDFVQRVPQYMIASYLGLTPEYVSELRKKTNKFLKPV